MSRSCILTMYDLYDPLCELRETKLISNTNFKFSRIAKLKRSLNVSSPNR